MRHQLKVTVIAAATLFSTGCTSWMESNHLATNVMPNAMPAEMHDLTSVSVRFVLPSEQERQSNVGGQVDAQLASDSFQDGYADVKSGHDRVSLQSRAFHVALWGGAYNGTDVTTHTTVLPAGSYTFAYFDQPNESAMQGWLDVRNTGSDMVSVLSRWKANLADQKPRLAFDMEVDGGMRSSDPEVFQSFKKQMRAYEQAERQLNAAIGVEYQAQQQSRKEIGDLLRNAEIVIMPGEESFFSAATQSTFNADDLEAVRAGGVVTKVVLAADFTEAKWKLRRLNQLFDDLARFEVVLREEADRLQRRKGLFLLTDHLYDHDKRFVENEMQLQHTLGLIDRVNLHASDLRERRMGLAFITSLFAPNDNFSTLAQEKQNLLRERTVIEAERSRLDRLVDETGKTNTRRVAFERSRQNAIASIEAINRQLQDVAQAKSALATMLESTDVIHRHNDMRLLATALVANGLPPRILQIIEQEAMMTIRLQATDKVFVPPPEHAAKANVNHPSDHADALGHHHEQPGSGMDSTRDAHETNANLVHYRENSKTAKVEPTSAIQKGQDDECPLLLKLFVPPCWLADDQAGTNQPND